MTWTYTPEDIATDRKDEVRYLVGDTNTDDQLTEDEEIAFVLVQYPPADAKPAWLAAAHVADAICAQFARKADRSVGSLQISAKQQRDHYRELAQDLRMLYATNGLGDGAGTGFASIQPAMPVLGGGGPTVLGGRPAVTVAQEGL